IQAVLVTQVVPRLRSEETTEDCAAHGFAAFRIPQFLVPLCYRFQSLEQFEEKLFHNHPPAPNGQFSRRDRLGRRRPTAGVMPAPAGCNASFGPHGPPPTTTPWACPPRQRRDTPVAVPRTLPGPSGTRSSG